VSNFRIPSLSVSEEVTTALGEGRGVVALETTIIVQGLPSPINFEVARECESAVRAGGAIPATIGLLNGRLVVGLTAAELEELADPDRGAAKLSARDLGLALAAGTDGATTVAGTIAVAHRVGIAVMATGGLGGVHRDAAASFDESADLAALARTPVLVVASGVKSILDVGATLERLDTLGVPVAGFQTRQFPGFYLRDSGPGLGARERTRGGGRFRRAPSVFSDRLPGRESGRRSPRTGPGETRRRPSERAVARQPARRVGQGRDARAARRVRAPHRWRERASQS
jgi:pseudouridine-5'-phosphate glycosidase